MAMEAIMEALKSSNPDRLSELSSSNDPQVRRAVAANDGTYMRTLRKLARDSDHQVSDVARISIERRNIMRNVRRSM